MGFPKKFNTINVCTNIDKKKQLTSLTEIIYIVLQWAAENSNKTKKCSATR